MARGRCGGFLLSFIHFLCIPLYRFLFSKWSSVLRRKTYKKNKKTAHHFRVAPSCYRGGGSVVPSQAPLCKKRGGERLAPSLKSAPGYQNESGRQFRYMISHIFSLSGDIMEWQRYHQTNIYVDLILVLNSKMQTEGHETNCKGGLMQKIFSSKNFRAPFWTAIFFSGPLFPPREISVNPTEIEQTQFSVVKLG